MSSLRRWLKEWIAVESRISSLTAARMGRPRLARSAAPPRHSPKLRSDATYMVTGGRADWASLSPDWPIAQERAISTLGQQCESGELTQYASCNGLARRSRPTPWTFPTNRR